MSYEIDQNTIGIKVDTDNNGTFETELTSVSCFEYEEQADGTISITEYTGNDPNVIIPQKIDKKAVTDIGNSAFKNRTDLISVIIPDGITSISDKAFLQGNGCIVQQKREDRFA